MSRVRLITGIPLPINPMEESKFSHYGLAVLSYLNRIPIDNRTHLTNSRTVLQFSFFHKVLGNSLFSISLSLLHHSFHFSDYPIEISEPRVGKSPLKPFFNGDDIMGDLR
jgi:hypothetical protein